MMFLTTATGCTLMNMALAAAPPTYEATVLPQLDPNSGSGGWVETSGYSLNNAGMVTGAVGFDHGFTWSAGGGGSLWLPEFAQSIWGTSINDAGEVVGGYVPSEVFMDAAFHRAADGTFTQLETFGQGLGATASAINNNGMIVGGAEVTMGGPGGGDTTAVYWQDGQIHEIGTLGGFLSVATAVNDNNMVAGYANTAGNQTVTGFTWTQAGGMVELERLSTTGASTPYAINDAGVVVGKAGFSLFDGEAVYWDSQGMIHQLDRFYAGQTGDAAVMDINNDGIMVGQEQGLAFSPEARLWIDDEVFHLADLVTNLPSDITLTEAVAINDAGQIIVNATTLVDGNTEFITVMLNAVPAPGALALLAPAMLGGLVRPRRRTC